MKDNVKRIISRFYTACKAQNLEVEEFIPNAIFRGRSKDLTTEVYLVITLEKICVKGYLNKNCVNLSTERGDQDLKNLQIEFNNLKVKVDRIRNEIFKSDYNL